MHALIKQIILNLVDYFFTNKQTKLQTKLSIGHENVCGMYHKEIF